jgi:exodeoxyribonuclease VII small subunit
MPEAEIPFEKAIAELEVVLRTLEDGSTTLDASLAAYERGVGLLKTCYERLANAELRIKQLTPAGESASVAPFEHKSKDPF